MSDSPMKKQALLIGINQYDILPQLKYARQDAEAVEQSLKYNYCFSDDEVMLLTDSRAGLFKPSNRIRILNHLDNLANQDLDLFIFGFWGHGVVRSGKRYLCPLDVSPDEVEQLGVPFDVLMDKLSKIRAKNTCLILDCCQRVHDGERSEEETFTAADQKAFENAARDIVLRRKEKEPEFVSNVAILNSCKEGQAAYEWDNRKHGIFTAHLLDAMNRRYDSVAQIVGYVSSNVEKTAKELNKQQTPLCSLQGDIPLSVDTKTTPLQTGEVFISYRHSNAALVAPIEEELKKRNISYFIDRVGVNYTMEYASAIAQAVKECKVLLFVWTQDADVSPDILREVTMALALKKRVLPYKIGMFNVTEHGSLFYQLSPISRYEVPRQTPETIVELVNQVEQALTGKTYQQYAFALPERSQDAVIQKPVIEDISVTVTPVQIKQSQPIQYKKIPLPQMPEELTKILAENKGREQAIAQLKDFTHESLAQANAAVAQAQAQLDAWDKRKEKLWKNLSEDVQQSLQKTISGNPQCTEANIKVSTDNMSNQEYLDLLEQFQCGKKHEQARLELERVQNQRNKKCNDVIKIIQQKIKSENAKVEEIKTKFMDDVLLSILAVLPGYEKPGSAFPEEIILEPLRLLDKYELGWRAPAAIARARILWNKHHPDVLDQRKSSASKLPPTNQRSFEWDWFGFTRIKKFIGNEKKVEIPEGVTEIEDRAFYDCSSLTSVVIPKSVKKIGEGAFYDCSSLTSVVIPEGVTKIEDGAFEFCSSLTSVVIPEGVTMIGSSAFKGCSSLTSVVIPEGVTMIGSSAFKGCSSLTSVVIPEAVTWIGDRAFDGCSSLTSVVIPEGVTGIGAYAFEGCSSLKSVVIPEGVTRIAIFAFKDCSSLTSVVIPKSMKVIEKDVFVYCSSLKSVVISEGVMKIEDSAFGGCRSLTSVVIPKSVKKIGVGAFAGCSSLTSVVIPKGVTMIGSSAFEGCSSLTSVVIPEGVTQIGNFAFKGCSSLKSVVIPRSVRWIEKKAFKDCSSLTSVVIPESVTQIGDGAFKDCSSLTSVVIPKSVWKIGYDAFYGCPVPWFSRAWWHKIWDYCTFWNW